MRKPVFVTAVLIAAPVAAVSQETDRYTCTYGDLTRRVVIMSEPGVSVPCQVHYFKDTEAPGERQILYSADRQAGYCEEKTSEFVTKLEGWGWSCSYSSQTETAPAADEQMEDEVIIDDTDALKPVEPPEPE